LNPGWYYDNTKGMPYKLISVTTISMMNKFNNWQNHHVVCLVLRNKKLLPNLKYILHISPCYEFEHSKEYLLKFISKNFGYKEIVAEDTLKNEITTKIQDISEQDPVKLRKINEFLDKVAKT